MKIAFDVHGTLDDDGDKMLRQLMEHLSLTNDIYIISGPPIEQIKEELDMLDVDYSNITIISVVDFLKSRNVKMEETPKGWFCDDEIWWNSKGMICEEYQIDMMFDDLVQYKRNMPETTKFVLWEGYSKQLKRQVGI